MTGLVLLAAEQQMPEDVGKAGPIGALLTVLIFIAILLIYAAGTAFLLYRVLADLDPRYRESAEESLVETAHVLATLVEQDVRDGAIDPHGRWFACPLDVQQQVWPTEDYELARSVVDSPAPEDDLFAGARSEVGVR